MDTQRPSGAYRRTHPDDLSVRVSRVHLQRLVEEIVKVLSEHPHDPSLNGLRECLDPVEIAAFPELRSRAPRS
jgi:hypothetical protein